MSEAANESGERGGVSPPSTPPRGADAAPLAKTFVSHDRLALLALVVVLLAFSAVGVWYALFHEREPADDRGRFQGEWKLVTPDRADGPVLVIRVEGDTWTYLTGGQPQKSYRLDLNPAAEPRQLTLTLLGDEGEPVVARTSAGKSAFVTLHGVYVVGKGKATVALAPGTSPRPKALDDPDAQTLTLERVKK